jgi:hypothetical protein
MNAFMRAVSARGWARAKRRRPALAGAVLGPVALLPAAASAALSFNTHSDFGTGTNPYSVAIADFNGDGKQDLATANYGSSNVSVLLGTGKGSFGAKNRLRRGHGPALGCDRRPQRRR